MHRAWQCLKPQQAPRVASQSQGTSHMPKPDCFSQLQEFSLIKEVVLSCNTFLTFTSTGWERLIPTETVHFYHSPEAPVEAPESRCHRDYQHHIAHTSRVKAFEFLSFSFCIPQPFSASFNKSSSLHLVKITVYSSKTWFLPRINCQLLHWWLNMLSGTREPKGIKKVCV